MSRTWVVGQGSDGHDNQVIAIGQTRGDLGGGLPAGKLAEELLDVLNLEGALLEPVMANQILHVRHAPRCGRPGARLARLGNPLILISSDGEAHADMSRPLLVLVLGVTALMVLSWALGRVISGCAPHFRRHGGVDVSAAPAGTDRGCR